MRSNSSVDLLALWADQTRVYALFRDGASGTGAVLPASVPIADGTYPALSPAWPAAAWFERMIRDLWGHTAEGGRDLRPWLDHGNWPERSPMSARPTPSGRNAEPPEFLPVEGEHLHQIGLGPIRGEIAEPGHLRFHAEGETIMRLEVRLGYAHKGQLALMRGKSARAAARFVARLSGDSTVAHSIAYARAVETALCIDAPARAHALRGVMAELERLANHFGDLAIITDIAGFALLPARFGFHREAMLQAAERAFGHRLMMDCAVPGGVADEIAPAGVEAILRAVETAAIELPRLALLYQQSAGMADRVNGIGVVRPQLAERFAVGGVVGRASGRGFDARRSPGYPPYAASELGAPVRNEGDVDARVRIRMEEANESCRLLREFLASSPAGPLAVELPAGSGEGIGFAEGFRGDIWHWIRLDGGLIAEAFPRDTSWLQWPVLEAIAVGASVTDFPLVEKSINCSYSGMDL